MRVLVYPHLMEVGGSQLNALELAREISTTGAEVVVFAPDGDLVPLVEEMGLDYVRAPVAGRWPARENLRALDALVTSRDIQLVHAYEWGPATEAAYGPQLRRGTATVVTVLSMSVPDVIPQYAPLLVGTASLAESQRARRGDVHLLEPPVDTRRNVTVDVAKARAEWGFDAGDFVVSVVGRLTEDLGKLPGVLEAVAAARQLAETTDVRLLVVGDGPGYDAVRRSATGINAITGRPTVIVQGSMLDPRPAYEAADVVIGMGSSLMKGMAFAKPVVVQGEHGFWRSMDESTLDLFLQQGWYGSGGNGTADLVVELARLAGSPSRRRELGELGRRTVEENFSLAKAAEQVVALYAHAIEHRPARPTVAAGVARLTWDIAKFETVRHLRRIGLRSD